MNSCYIIAEAGVNHNGNLELAKEMIHAAKKAGANAVKFQLFEAQALVTKKAKQAEYQILNCKAEQTQFEMLKNLELSRDNFIKLAETAKSVGIDYLITPFDLESLDFIVNTLDLPTIKIASGDITFGPLLLKAAQAKRKIILSTGMSTIEDIEHALKIIVFGALAAECIPEPTHLEKLYHSEEAKAYLQEYVTLLHCVSQYPAPYDDIDLKAMDVISEQFHLPVGLSDHSEGIVVPMAAVARGATVIEKHFTLDKHMPGPDHLASLDLPELEKMIEGIRIVERALGQGKKIVKSSEAKNQALVRRSLIANQAIQAGEKFTESNIAMKRPGEGISPMRFWDYLGQEASKAYEQDEVLQ